MRQMCIFMQIGAVAMDHWQANVNHSHMRRDLETSHSGTAHQATLHSSNIYTQVGLEKASKDTLFLTFFIPLSKLLCSKLKNTTADEGACS